MIKKYKQIKPYIVEAVLWTGKNTSDILNWGNGEIRYNVVYGRRVLELKTEDDGICHMACVGEYVIKMSQNEFYGCDKEHFESLYNEIIEGRSHE